jgi:hypothetical protein
LAEDTWYIVAEYRWRIVAEDSWYILGECYWYIIGCSMTRGQLDALWAYVGRKKG